MPKTVMYVSATHLILCTEVASSVMVCAGVRSAIEAGPRDAASRQSMVEARQPKWRPGIPQVELCNSFFICPRSTVWLIPVSVCSGPS